MAQQSDSHAAGRFRLAAHVVHALVIREFKTRFGHYHFGYLWALAEPVAHVAVLSIIFGLRSRTTPEGIDFPVFLATGIIPFLLFRRMITRGMSAIEGNRALFSYRQVKPLDTLIARAVLEITIYSIVFVVFMAGAGWLGFDIAAQDPLGVMAVFFTLGLFGLGLGALACVFATFVPDATLIVPLILRPLYFISGIFFSIERVPAEYREYLLWNPVLHAMELIRASYFQRIDTAYGDPLYLLWFTVGALSLGLLTFHACRFRMVST